MMTKDSTVPSTRHIWSEHSQPDVSDADILVRDLVKIYASTGVEVQALQGLSLKVSRGEVVAIIGASGSGKSTLLSILSGHNTPTAGQAWVAGRNLTTLTLGNESILLARVWGSCGRTRQRTSYRI